MITEQEIYWTQSSGVFKFVVDYNNGFLSLKLFVELFETNQTLKSEAVRWSLIWEQNIILGSKDTYKDMLTHTNNIIEKVNNFYKLDFKPMEVNEDDFLPF